ncbi:MAG: T9SS type A sorting domain-containing protein, partial [Saprospiraceae bacterium]
DLQMQADGKLLIISAQRVQTNVNIGTVRRCLADGQLDTGYGNNGRVTLSITQGVNFIPNASTLQPDGKLLITGTYGAGASSGFPVFRLNTDGSFDNSFNSDGIAFKALGSNTTSAVAESIAVGNDGKIYVAGSAPTPTEVPLTMIALTPGGGTFGTFGTFGVARIPFGTFATSRKILVQPDGKLLVGGFVFASQTSTSLVLARLNLNGTPDPDFGNQAGRFVTRIDVPYDVQTLEDIEILPDGRLITMSWLNETINLGQPGNVATAYVLRFLTDILVKAEEPSPIFQKPEVFPNPILQNGATLRFFLAEAAAVSIHLYDASGLEMATLQPVSSLPAGLQEIQLDLPKGLSPGTYFISLRKGTAQKVLRITKPE